MSIKKIELLNTVMKETSDKRLYERYLVVHLHLEGGHTFDESGDLLSRAR